MQEHLHLALVMAHAGIESFGANLQGRNASN